MILLTTGERLRAIRTYRRLKGKELARISGVTGTTITAIEKGRIKSPGADTLRELADALDVTLDFLAGSVTIPERIEEVLGPQSFELFLRRTDRKAMPDGLEDTLRRISQVPSAPKSVQGWIDLVQNLQVAGFVPIAD